MSAAVHVNGSAARVFLVAVQYYLDDQQLGARLARLQQALRAAGFASTVETVDLRPASLPPGEMIRRHPFLDMSGFRAGIARRDDNEVVVLLNDTLFTKHPCRLLTRKVVGLLPMLAAISVPAAAGVVHPTTGLVMRDADNPTRQHLSTFLVAANRAGAQVFADLLGSLPGADDPLGERWLAAQRARFAALGPLLEVHLGGVRNPWVWHGMRPGADPALVQRKAITVAVEYLFTCHLLAAGGCILPVNPGVRFKLDTLREQLARRLARALGVRT